MTIRVYRGTDAGAPLFSNVAGATTTIFDACLVNGYGAQPGMGWTIEHSATNKRVYRAPMGRRYYLRVDDSAAPAATAAGRTQVSGYETMTGVDTGTEQFPTVANYGFCRRSSTTGTINTWILIATERSFYWFPELTTKVMHFFGDYVCTNTNFMYNTLLSGTVGATTSASAYSEGLTQTSQKFLMRNYSGINSGDTQYVHTYNSMIGSVLGASTLDQVNLMDNIYYMDAVGIRAGNTFYGYMPGLYAGCFPAFSSVTTFSGSGAYAGTEFIAIPTVSSGMAIIKTSGEWY